MKSFFISLAALWLCGGALPPAAAQDNITNAFDDLKRRGAVQGEHSPMREAATAAQLETLMNSLPRQGYFCFTEDRSHAVQRADSLPVRWVRRPAAERADFRGTAAPGEFYTWQVALYAPLFPLRNITLQFSALKATNGRGRIPADSIRCFNLGGIDLRGRQFAKRVDIPMGRVQSLWCGVAVPDDIPVGTYAGRVTVRPEGMPAMEIPITLKIEGTPVSNGGTDEGWRLARLRWLDSQIGVGEVPTAPYVPIAVEGNAIDWLGGRIVLGDNGLPATIATRYDTRNRLDSTVSNPVLAAPMRFIVETADGQVETFAARRTELKRLSDGRAGWRAAGRLGELQIEVEGTMEFDGFGELDMRVTSKKDMEVKDIRLEVPYTAYAARYAMGLGRKGGFRQPDAPAFVWDTTRHQDALWMGNVNAGLNLKFKDPSNYRRPLVNIYYALGRLRMPGSWGNGGRGGVRVAESGDSCVVVTAYCGPRTIRRGETLDFGLEMSVTPVKPLDMEHHVTERFYHSNSDLSERYIPAAREAGANFINIHHKKEIYPYINYPYFDECAADFRAFADSAAAAGIGMRAYYTTRELTVKVPELWALRSLGDEVIHDGPGKDTRTLIHPDGPNRWLSENLGDHFIPAWFNAFREGKYRGEMDISVITTPDSRWNNYYLEGLQWMIRNYGLRGIYIDDSALDRETLKRARRLLDGDGVRRQIDIHSWNHMNEWAGYANSLHMYLDLLPYVDRTWLGEGFGADNTPDFWLVEMSGIPFGLMSETLDAQNVWRGMVYGMAPRLPWSGNPVPLWKLWDAVGMQRAVMSGWWDPAAPATTDNANVLATTYKLPGEKALLAVANWTNEPQSFRLTIDADRLGFVPVQAALPEVETLQSAAPLDLSQSLTVEGGKGLFILLY
ncbi:glycoside hydrolase domain-containing protein [uncultured Rikenella sp.]|uniref:glycoside hydrolase domain-containing protein n=1 Tax=uncultured Rikenella sp. TaxID=368003 RepID=UPI0026302F4A|nr:glycoside hydrolase domain-containing protein [uncultured Rikenella sp.]